MSASPPALTPTERAGIGLLRNALGTLRDAGLRLEVVPDDACITVWRREPPDVTRLLARIPADELLLDALPTED